MDLIQKLSLLTNEERKDEFRFREMMVVREKIAKLKNEIAEIGKDCQSLEIELKKVEQIIPEVEIEVKFLESQEKATKETAKKQLTKVIEMENELKNMKKELKTHTESTINEIRKIKDEYYSEMNFQMINSKPNDNSDDAINLRECWRLEGEIEATELYEKYQDEKIMNMENIKQLMEDFQIIEKTVFNEVDEMDTDESHVKQL